MEGEREKSILLQMKSNSYMFNKSNKCHYFELSNGEQLSCKLIKSITDPIYDSNFKRLFGVSGAEKRLIDLLNSLLFPGEEVNKIISVKYLSNEFHKFNQKHDKGSLRTDIACEISINGIIYVVAIEMQIGAQGTLNKRLFNYGTSLRNIKF